MNWRLCLIFALCCGAAASFARPAWAWAKAPKAAAEKGEAGAGDEAGGHHHEHVGAKGASLSPAEFKSDLAIWTFVVFLLLLLVLWKFAWGPIAAGLEKREHGIHEHIESAKRTHVEAKNLLAEYEQRLAHAAEQVREMLEESRRDAEHTKQEIMNEAKAAAQAERDRALLEIERATDRALSELSQRSADLAVDLAGKILRTKLTPQEHSQLVQEAVARFPAGSPSVN